MDCFYLKGLKSLELKSWLWWLVISRGGFGMGFFGDSQFPIPILGIADGDFSFRARSKNPRDFKSRGWESGIENPQKSLVKISEKSPISGIEIRDFWGRKIPHRNLRKIPNFYLQGLGIFENLGILSKLRQYLSASPQAKNLKLSVRLVRISL